MIENSPQILTDLSGTTNIRNSFSRFFKGNGFAQEERVSPTFYGEYWNLLLTNSAIVRLGPVLQGKERLTKPIYLCQPCLKGISDRVGVREGYLTYFEQFGAGSQSHSKTEAIQLLWTFLTKEMKFDKDQFLATISEGDEEMQAAWKSLGFNKEQILPFSGRNQRELCNNQVTGEVTAIIIDRGRQQHDKMALSDSSKCHLDCECGRYSELGDIVFLSTRDANNVVDFGLGLERLEVVLSGKESVFAVGELGYISRLIRSQLQEPDLLDSRDILVKRLSDHLRFTVFALGEGIQPDNRGSGYVIRRVIRQMILTEIELGLQGKLIDMLVSKVIAIMAVNYPFLEQLQGNIIKTVSTEEERFSAALERGKKYFSRFCRKGNSLNSEEVYKLYESYGLPVEVIEKLTVDNNVQWNKEDLMSRIKK